MNPTIQWPDKTLPVEIYCAPGVLTGLEMVAVDALLAMPRIGLGTGGLLLGRRSSNRIEILKTQEILCSHARGPAFVLTPEELTTCLNGLSDDELGDHSVVGWYCSKSNGPMTMTEHDRAFFDALCPESWQTTLLIRPRNLSATVAAFGFRRECNGEDEITFLLGSPFELSWQELASFQSSRQETALPSGQVTEATEPELADSAEAPVSMPHSGTLFGVPDDPRDREGPDTAGKRRRWPYILLAALAVLTTLGAAAFETRDRWIPRPAIALVASSDWNGRVTFLWNADAIRPEDDASLVIEDASRKLSTVHLDATAMRTGWYRFDGAPGSVTATLLAGDVSDKVTIRIRPETYLPESGISK